jgi:hypothetical protein
VLLYDDFNGSSVSNLLTAELNQSYDNAGYHSVELSSPVSVASGDDIYAVVKITDVSYTFPIAYDPFGPAESGCCYISATGSMFSEWGGGDIGIRLRATEDAGCGGLFEHPAIVSTIDVPADNGGYVALSWRRSIYDSEGSEPEIKRYRVWRRRREVLPSMMTLGSVGQLGGPFEHGLSGPAWEVVGTVEAVGGCCYEFNAPTHCDSGPGGDCWVRFCVTAHTGAIGEHFDSPVDSGYSVDNLGMLNLASERVSGTEDDDPVETTSLAVPQPNPGTDGLRIQFSLAEEDWIQLHIYDIKGRRVASVFEGSKTAGTHEVVWDPDSHMENGLSPGLYFVRLVTTSRVATAKLLNL